MAVPTAPLTQLKSLDFVDSDNVAAIGFCFGGAMTLNMARAGGSVKVAISLHGEYPEHGEYLSLGASNESYSWNVGYFVEVVGDSDPLIPAAKTFSSLRCKVARRYLLRPQASWVNE